MPCLTPLEMAIHPYGEGVREDSIPSHVGTLVDIHDDEEPDENLGEIQSDEFAKECTEFYHIEGLAIVHEATEDFRTIPEEVTDGFQTEPGTHEG